MPETRRPSRSRPVAPAVAALAACALALSISLGAAQAGRGETPTQGPRPVTAGNALYGMTDLHQIKVSIPAAEWAVLQTSSARGGGTGGTDYRDNTGRLIHVGSGFGGYFPWVHADLSADGTTFKDVGIRYKGNLSFSTSSAAAPLFANFKLKIDVHDTKGTWDGEKTFNLHPGVIDSSKMRDAIAFATFRAAGVPAPRTTFAEIEFTVPGVYQATKAGLFTMIEEVNGRFLERVLPPGTGLVMKPEGLRGGIQNLGDTWLSYEPRLRPDREATLHEQQRIMEFSKLVSQTDVALFRSKVGSYLDVDEFLRYVAVNAFIANTDNYLTNGHNFYLYLDPRDDKFRFIPWDQDLSMGSRPGRGGGGFGPDIMQPFTGDQALIYWLLDDPAVSARYKAILRELSKTAFSRATQMALIDRLEQVGTGRGPSPRSFVEGRVAAVEQLVAGWGDR